MAMELELVMMLLGLYRSNQNRLYERSPMYSYLLSRFETDNLRLPRHLALGDGDGNGDGNGDGDGDGRLYLMQRQTALSERLNALKRRRLLQSDLLELSDSGFELIHRDL